MSQEETNIQKSAEGFAFKTSEEAVPQSYLQDSRNLLRLVVAAVKAHERPAATPRQGPVYLPMAELYRQVAQQGNDALTQDCELLLNQVLNLFQTDYTARQPHVAAIVNQAAAIDTQLDRLTRPN